MGLPFDISSEIAARLRFDFASECPTVASDQSLNEPSRRLDANVAVLCPYPLSVEGRGRMLMTAEPRGVLSVEAMKGEAGWDAALNLPWPQHPDFYLLDEARQHVIAYLDWVTHDLAQGPSPNELRREIERGAARLLEISLALRAVLSSGSGDED